MLLSFPTKNLWELILCNAGDKDDDDDDDAEDKLQSSGIANGEHIRQESQEQSEVDHGDFEMVVSPECFSLESVKCLGLI